MAFLPLRGSDLSCKVYECILCQPYQVHLNRNSSEVVNSVITKINLTVGGLNAFLQLLASSVIGIGLLTSLLFVDPYIALTGFALFGGSYAIMALVNRRELRVNGEKIVEASARQLRAIQEGLGAIRDILLGNFHATYIHTYKTSDRPLRLFQAKNNFLGTYPRYVLESLGLVSIGILGASLVVQNPSNALTIPLLGAMALGAQRMLPILQQIYGSWASLKDNPAMSDIVNILKDCILLQENSSYSYEFKQSIVLKNISFKYNPESSYVLKDVHLSITPGECIGFIGTTGCGKSTLVDIIMGFLKPTSGQILVDGVDIHNQSNPELVQHWQSLISHVPQTIYLSDSSVAENIALGIPKHKIDMEKVRVAASQAQISDFIESCQYGYDSFVGERGFRISGGQRQRIGIARALYRESKLLVLDEATSALDLMTESSVMSAVNNLDMQITVLMIAHRLATLQRCDKVVRIEGGKISAVGPPDDILQN